MLQVRNPRGRSPSWLRWVSVCVACIPAGLLAAELEPASDTAKVAAETPIAAIETPALVWHTKYEDAMTAAIKQGKMMLVFFHNADSDKARRAFETKSLADPQVMAALSQFVVAKVPVDSKIKMGGKDVRILSHAALEPMLNRQGVAILDFQNKTAPYYGFVTTAFPFDPGRYCTPQALRVLVTLPPGTLTQRTMIFAVRIHPEFPASTQGDFFPILAKEAEKHSLYQASIRVQGHHAWDSRFHSISARMPQAGHPTEVVAESWPGETLVVAAIECVHSWRQSPGHWDAVKSRHGLFGYDMKRGANGIWYATGIFAKDQTGPIRRLITRPAM